MPGEGEFYTTDGRGGLDRLNHYRNWRSSWTLIIDGLFGGSGYSDLLFYDSSAGEGEFYTTDGRGGISLLRRYDNWRRTWLWIIPGNFGESRADTDLLFYDRRAGVGEFYTTDGRGGISLLRRYDNWRKTWDVIIPGNFKAVPGEFGAGPYTDLLFYDRVAGEGEFYSTDGRGGLTFLSRHSWETSWSMIIPGSFGTGELYFTDLLFYDHRAGEGWFYTSDGRGGLNLLRHYDNWRTSWARIIPGNFGGTDYTDLLFYDNSTGEGEFYTTDGRGGISLLRRYDNWRKTWDLIIPGTFGLPGETVFLHYTDLLFYDNNIVAGPVD